MASLEMPDPAEIEEYAAELAAELAATEAGDPERGRLLHAASGSSNSRGTRCPDLALAWTRG